MNEDTKRTVRVVVRDAHGGNAPDESHGGAVCDLEGTNRYTNAAGTFVATGRLNFFTGEAVGTYTLLVCHAQ